MSCETLFQARRVDSPWATPGAGEAGGWNGYVDSKKCAGQKEGMKAMSHEMKRELLERMKGWNGGMGQEGKG